MIFLVGKNKADVDKVISKLRNLNMRIEYTASIIKTYEKGQLGNFLKLLADEIQNPQETKSQ